VHSPKVVRHRFPNVKIAPWFCVSIVMPAGLSVEKQ
jgi:hypothetical protein